LYLYDEYFVDSSEPSEPAAKGHHEHIFENTSLLFRANLLRLKAFAMLQNFDQEGAPGDKGLSSLTLELYEQICKLTIESMTLFRTLARPSRSLGATPVKRDGKNPATDLSNYGIALC